MNLKFIYFDFPFWRSEVGKLTLYLGGIQFENIMVSGDEFQRVKKTGQLDDGTIIPFHQLPCLLVDQTPISQTAGIARFCGKLTGIYPKNDDILAAKIDQILDFITDMTVLVASTGKDDDNNIKIDKRRKLASGDLARKLMMLEKNIEDKRGWSIGDKLGLPDIAIWRFMGWLSCGSLDGLPTDILKDYPKIMRICHNVEEHAGVQDWINSTYPKNYIRGNYLIS